MAQSEREAFFRSQSLELRAKADRVRNLIGDKHWYTDGAFKESILLDAISARLPSGMFARRGFVLNQTLDTCSKEQDCIVFDRLAAVPVFEAVDFHMVVPCGVTALVSVKTKFEGEEFLDSMTGLATALALVAQDPCPKNPLSAIFFFDADAKAKHDTVVGWVQKSILSGVWPIVHHDPVHDDRVFGPLLAFSLNDRCFRVDFHDGKARVIGYRLPGMAPAIFLLMIERAAHQYRDHDGAAAWSILETIDAEETSITELPIS